MYKRQKHIKMLLASFLMLLHLLIISGEYRVHHHHIDEHHSEILTVIDCEYGYSSPVNLIMSYQFDESHHESCCHHNQVMSVNLSDNIQQKSKIFSLNFIVAEVYSLNEIRGNKTASYTLNDNYKSVELKDFSTRAPPLS